MRKVIFSLALAIWLPLSARAAEIVARVLSVEGEAFAQDRPLRVGMKLGPGVTVSTKSCARIKLLLLPRAVAYLGPDSKMKLGKAEQPNKVLGGMFRFIYSKAEEFKKNLLSKGTFTSTVTDSAVVGIRGTDYVLVCNPVLGETEVISLEGTLRFSNAADDSDVKEIPPEHWGGVGGRFGAKIPDLIHLPSSVLDHFKGSLSWETQMEGTMRAEDLNGEAIPEEAKP